MATRTVEIEDDEFEELEEERDGLLDRVEVLEFREGELAIRVEELEDELQELQEKWDDVEALLIRIGELG